MGAIILTKRAGRRVLLSHHNSGKEEGGEDECDLRYRNAVVSGFVWSLEESLIPHTLLDYKGNENLRLPCWGEPVSTAGVMTLKSTLSLEVCAG